MTYYDVYLGRLDDPTFCWDGGDYDGNVPRRISPFFPPKRSGLAFRELIRRIETGLFEGKQTDFGGWVARVKRSEVIAFIDAIYADDPTYKPESSMPHLRDQLIELRRFVDTLDPETQWALVATEL